MIHATFGKKSSKFKVAILIKEDSFDREELEQFYVKPLTKRGIAPEDVTAFSLFYQGKKVTAAQAREYLGRLLPALKRLGVTQLVVADAFYFKILTGCKKADSEHGYVHPCKVKDLEYFNVSIVPNYKGRFFNERVEPQILYDIDVVADFLQGNYEPPGVDIIKNARYVDTLVDFRAELRKLHAYPRITCDVECFSLKHYKAGLGTIAFATDIGSGFACVIDRTIKHPSKFFCAYRQALVEFFQDYEGVVMYHNATFDIKILIFNLFMQNINDQAGLLRGLEVMTKKVCCTKIVTYLATNNTGGNKLGLKDQSYEFAGNYAVEEINDINKIPTAKLLEYNLVDCFCTWYVYEKHWQRMVDEDQLDIYNEIFIPSLKVIIQMELTGMCVDMNQIHHCEKLLEAELISSDVALRKLPEIDDVINYKKTVKLLADNEKLKTKKREWHELDGIDFNPNSQKDLQLLLHEILDYPVLDKTEGGAPGTGAKTIKKHLADLKQESHRVLFESLISIAECSIILNNFIKNFKEAELGTDGNYWLFGSFNLGGTVSGRLSSSNPNMQNIPSSGTRWAKPIKECFIAPDGWIFCGADFASLEDRISALTTQDPMKLKVYTDGYDGHCLRAYYYFPEAYEGIPETPDAINATKDTHEKWRQRSKTPTFALTYGGTYMAIIEQAGLPKAEAIRIERNYHELYSVSDEWVQSHIERATSDGYVTCAFGLRVRTPLLKRTVLNARVTPYQAKKEARTAGNALGQSWGLLNNRAAIEVQQKTLRSAFAMSIKPGAHIHDAQYFYVKDDKRTLKYLNDVLGQAMAWQGLPIIQHDVVKLSGELDVFYPSWAHKKTLPNNISINEITQLCDEHFESLEAKGIV